MALFKLNDDSLLVSLDIGSYAVRCAVFKKSEQFPLELLAFTEKKSLGLEESRITNFEDLSLVFSEVLESAEELCKSSFSEVWLGFSPPFHSFRSQGMVALTSREVTLADLNLAVQTACAVPLPNQHICLHSCPESFRVDNQSEVLNPLGLSGLRLETEVCLVTIPQFYCRDIVKSLKLLGYTPRSFFHNLVAFGHNFTSLQQKKNGVCVCDIGDKSTRVIVYLNGKIEKMFLIPMGGKNFSQALASQFNIPMEEVEFLKEKEGQLLFGSYEEGDSIEAVNTSLYLSRKLFVQTLEKTAENLLEKIKSVMIHQKFMDKISSGFIFTGGTAYLPGFTELASFYLGGQVSHPEKLYEDFKQTHNLALIQQAYLENKLKPIKPNFSGKWSVWKELF